jgi:hypothetical protein
MHHMSGNRKWRAVKIALLVVVGIAVFGFVVMSLWNWLVPPIIGWKPIDYWQALGLFLLAKILFGFGGHGHGHRQHMLWRARWAERWEKMTPEEREKFREGMRARWCGPRAESHPSALGPGEG